MNRRTALAVTTMALSGAALSAGTAQAQQRPLKDQLIGTWTLVSSETTASNGTKRRCRSGRGTVRGEGKSDGLSGAWSQGGERFQPSVSCQVGRPHQFVLSSLPLDEFIRDIDIARG